MEGTLTVGHVPVIFETVEDAHRAFAAMSKGRVIKLEYVNEKYERFFDNDGLSVRTGTEDALPFEALEAHRQGRYAEYQAEQAEKLATLVLRTKYPRGIFETDAKWIERVEKAEVALAAMKVRCDSERTISNDADNYADESPIVFSVNGEPCDGRR